MGMGNLFFFMPSDKKSFILYADLIHTVRKLPPEKAGQLFMTILQYINEEDFDVQDLLVEIAFEPIKQQLIRDSHKWDERIEQNSINGKKGGRPRKANETQINPNNPPLFLKSEKSLNDNDSVNDSVNGNVISKDNKDILSASPPVRQKMKQFIIPSVEEVKEYAESEMIGSKDSPDSFYNYYEARGWMMQKTPMKNWKAAYKNWTKNEKQYEAVKGTNQHRAETKTEQNERLYRDFGKELTGGRPLPDIFELCRDSEIKR